MKKILLLIIITLICYNLIPGINAMFNLNFMLFDALIINAILIPMITFIYTYNNKFKWYIPLVMTLLFIPTMLLFYNTSAAIYLIFYLATNYLGAILAKILTNKQQKNL